LCHSIAFPTHLQDNGYEIEINGEMQCIYGAVICLLGDTPGSNFVGGFKEGVGFSLRKCRRCLAVASDMREEVIVLGLLVLHIHIGCILVSC